MLNTSENPQTRRRRLDWHRWRWISAPPQFRGGENKLIQDPVLQYCRKLDAGMHERVAPTLLERVAFNWSEVLDPFYFSGVPLHDTMSFLHQAPFFRCGTVPPLIELCPCGRRLRLHLGHHLGRGRWRWDWRWDWLWDWRCDWLWRWDWLWHGGCRGSGGCRGRGSGGVHSNAEVDRHGVGRGSGGGRGVRSR